MSGKKKHGCSCCNRSFGSSDALRQHSEALGHGSGHECEACKRFFKNRPALEQHLASSIHVPSLTQPREESRDQQQNSSTPTPAHQCNMCGRRFGSQEALSQHVSSPAHALAPVRAPAPVYECTECEVHFSSLLALDNHLDSALHNSVALVQAQISTGHEHQNGIYQPQGQRSDPPGPRSTANTCIECNRNFKDEEALRQHRRDSAAHALQCHECVECGVWFGSVQEADDHLRSPAHVLVSEWTAAGHDINDLQDLVDQLDSLALGSATDDHHDHQCVECDGTFGSAEELDEHLRSPVHVMSFEGDRWFMFPALHRIISQSVDSSIPAPWFNREDTTDDLCQEYETNIVGAFRCSSRRRCLNRWTSGHVCIWIRGFPDNGYNAVVFNQRCLKCDSIGRLAIDHDSYVDRVSRWINIWNGVSIGRERRLSRETPPHEEDHCEGCQAGRCLRGRRLRGLRH